jgi:hypothetical protein
MKRIFFATLLEKKVINLNRRNNKYKPTTTTNVPQLVEVEEA